MKWLESFSSPLAEYSYLDVPLVKWLVLLIFAALAWMTCRFAMARTVRRLPNIARKTAAQWDDLILKILEKTHGVFIFLLSLYVFTLILNTSAGARELVYKFLVVSLFFQASIWGNEIVSFFLRQYLAKRNGFGSDSDINLSAYSAISITARFVLWSVLFLLLLDNLGINITALVTGLGIGGIAIALAVQNILGDIFASLSIILDRPFEVGDFIVVGDKAGTVENIGLKTSRIKSLSGEQLVFPNKTLIETDIRNFKRMQTRRIVFSFGVVYDTPLDQLRAIPKLVKDIIESINQVQFDRAHFLKYGDSSLDFEVVYIMQVPDYNIYMDTQQEVNFKLFECFAKEGIEFAYPTRTVIIRSDEKAHNPG